MVYYAGSSSFHANCLQLIVARFWWQYLIRYDARNYLFLSSLRTDFFEYSDNLPSFRNLRSALLYCNICDGVSRNTTAIATRWRSRRHTTTALPCCKLIQLLRSHSRESRVCSCYRGREACRESPSVHARIQRKYAHTGVQTQSRKHGY